MARDALRAALIMTVRSGEAGIRQHAFQGIGGGTV
jgi:hypothetical protein